MNRDILCIGYDIASQQVILAIGRYLTKLGYHPIYIFKELPNNFTKADGEDFLLMDNPHIDTVIQQTVKESVMVISGMSSFPDLAKNELTAIKAAIGFDVPFCLIADTFYYSRPHFDKFLPQASALFVITEELAEEARERFPDLNVAVSGNPVWAHFSSPTVSREESRKMLDNIPDDVEVVLIPLGKSEKINLLHVNGVITATKDEHLKKHNKLLLVVTPHPRDKVNYQALTEQNPGLIRIERSIPCPDLIPAADLIVASISTISIEAAYRVGAGLSPVPCIDYMTQQAIARMDTQRSREFIVETNPQLSNNGVGIWPPCDAGISLGLFAESSDKLAFAMDQLLNHESDLAQMQFAAQRATFPPREAGESLAIIAEVIEKILTSH